MGGQVKGQRDFERKVKGQRDFGAKSKV